MKIVVYVEGGGKGKDLETKCRAGFRAFFEKLLPPGSLHKIRIVRGGSCHDAHQKFCFALSQDDGVFPILLVDAEEAVAEQNHLKPWQHLNQRAENKLAKPNGADDDQAHLMVQVMESWFLADKEKLTEFFGPEFKTNALPGQPDVELIAKKRVLESLKGASSGTQKKGTFDKAKHGFDILAMIDPGRVRQASAHAGLLFDTLIEKINN